jgi:hypothetical protein
MDKRDDPQFRRCDTPPRLGRIITIIRIGESEVRTFAVLSTRLFGVYTHWSGEGRNGRTIRCHSDARKCKGCKQEMPRRWKGFLCVSSVEGKGKAFLELTPYAADLFMESLKDRIDARGMLIAVKRERKSLRSPLLIEHIGEYGGVETLPPQADPEPTLIRLWGLRNED